MQSSAFGKVVAAEYTFAGANQWMQLQGLQICHMFCGVLQKLVSFSAADLILSLQNCLKQSSAFSIVVAVEYTFAAAEYIFAAANQWLQLQAFTLQQQNCAASTFELWQLPPTITMKITGRPIGLAMFAFKICTISSGSVSYILTVTQNGTIWL